MKIKLILIAVFTFLAFDSFAYKLIINKSKVGGDGTGNYIVINRFVVDDIVTIEGVPRIQSRTINISCVDPGPSQCPSSIANNNNGDLDSPPVSEFFSLQAINAAQSLLQSAEDQSSSGGNGNNSGTIATPDGKSYLYNLSWETNQSGVTIINLVFEDAN